ncbi:hypothetical protein HJ158_24065 [Vibrio parahaemolyticus]|nr:hypothetical protein [Vibrio parahaemolyticus]
MAGQIRGKLALRVPKKSALGKAVHYTLDQWDKLVGSVANGCSDVTDQSSRYN